MLNHTRIFATYSKIVCAKLYTTQTATTADDLFNDRILP